MAGPGLCLCFLDTSSVSSTALSWDAGGPPIGLLKFASAKAAMHLWVSVMAPAPGMRLQPVNSPFLSCWVCRLTHLRLLTRDPLSSVAQLLLLRGAAPLWRLLRASQLPPARHSLPPQPEGRLSAPGGLLPWRRPIVPGGMQRLLLPRCCERDSPAAALQGRPLRLASLAAGAELLRRAAALQGLLGPVHPGELGCTSESWTAEQRAAACAVSMFSLWGKRWGQHVHAPWVCGRSAWLPGSKERWWVALGSLECSVCNGVRWRGQLAARSGGGRLWSALSALSALVCAAWLAGSEE